MRSIFGLPRRNRGSLSHANFLQKRIAMVLWHSHDTAPAKQRFPQAHSAKQRGIPVLWVPCDACDSGKVGRCFTIKRYFVEEYFTMEFLILIIWNKKNNVLPYPTLPPPCKICSRCQTSMTARISFNQANKPYNLHLHLTLTCRQIGS